MIKTNYCKRCTSKQGEKRMKQEIKDKIEQLERMLKSPRPYLPITWKEDLPVMPIENVIEMMKELDALVENSETKSNGGKDERYKKDKI